jgi:hypothetical protein
MAGWRFGTGIFVCLRDDWVNALHRWIDETEDDCLFRLSPIRISTVETVLFNQIETT